jgi:putative tricarboxylic transport membrane protein
LKINDAVTGIVLVALGLVILWHIQGFPAMPGQRFGPAWFPGIVAAGLAVCGSMLVARGMRGAAPWLVLDPWTRRARPLAGFASVIAGLAFYVIAVERLGFHVTAFLLLVGWLRVLGARWTLTLAVALAAPVVLHLAFYKILHVPLPWGVLERFAF